MKRQQHKTPVQLIMIIMFLIQETLSVGLHEIEGRVW